MTASTYAPSTVKIRRIPADTILIVAVIALVAAGLLLVFDASFPLALDSTKVGHDPLYFGKQQAKGLFGGVVCMMFAYRIGYGAFRQISGFLMGLGVVLLTLVWFPHVGIVHLHAARWVHLGLTFQPSEVAKLTLVLYLAAMLSKPKFKITNLKKGVLPPLVAAGMCMLLIFSEPDLGTTIVLFATFITMMCAAGAHARHIMAIILLPIVLIPLKGGLKPGQMQRINVYLQQGEDSTGPGYQAYHSKLAIGSGVITGVGWGSGREKYYLPEANSDYIFATLGEELGLVGSAIVVLAFGVVTWCGFIIARQAADPFGRMLATGITALISWQALINIAVVTVSIPATGVPLPFISYGSTSLILTLVSIGILLSIAQNTRGARIEAA